MEKRKRTGSMLCYPLEERRLTEAKFGWKHYFPHITQPKLDGERCRAICRGHEKPILLSSTESIITSVPHINKALQKKCFHGELDGELYIKGMDFDDISSIVSRTVNLHPDYEQMEYHIFDIVDKYSQVERLIQLEEHVSLRDHPLRTVDFDLAHSFSEIIKMYEKYLAAGYEGIIVRHKLALYERKRSRFILKFKPKKSDVYKIVGYKQMRDKNGKLKEMLGAIQLTSDEGTIFWASSGLSDIQKKLLWKNPEALIEKYVKLRYQSISSKGTPKFHVDIDILDENPEEEPEEEFGGIL